MGSGGHVHQGGDGRVGTESGELEEVRRGNLAVVLPDIAEIAGPGRFRQDGAHHRERAGAALLLVVDEEKQLVFQDGTAHVEAELVDEHPLLVDAGGVVEVVVGVEGVVAVVVEDLAVIGVAPGPGHELGLGASQAGIHVGVGGGDAHLLDEALLHRNDSEEGIGSNEGVLVVDSVQGEVVEGASSPVDGGRARPAGAGHACLGKGQLGHVAAVQGKILDLLPAEVGIDFRVDLVDHGLSLGRRHHHRLGHHTHLHDDVDIGGGAQLDLNLFNQGRLEAGQRGFDPIGPQGNLGKHVKTGAVGGGLPRQVGGDVGEGHRHPRHDGAGLIQHPPIHPGGQNLPAGGNGRHKQHHRKGNESSTKRECWISKRSTGHDTPPWGHLDPDLSIETSQGCQHHLRQGRNRKNG